jgi:hypothetical protein
MEEDCGGGQGITKGCGAKGRRRIPVLALTDMQSLSFAEDNFNTRGFSFIHCRLGKTSDNVMYPCCRCTEPS